MKKKGEGKKKVWKNQPENIKKFLSIRLNFFFTLMERKYHHRSMKSVKKGEYCIYSQNELCHRRLSIQGRNCELNCLLKNLLFLTLETFWISQLEWWQMKMKKKKPTKKMCSMLWKSFSVFLIQHLLTIMTWKFKFFFEWGN